MKHIIITISIVFFSLTVSACDICGCGVGNYYIGLLPHFSRNFLGVRYQFSRFNTNIKDDATQYSKDLFQTMQIWGGWNIGKRWQVLAILPFNVIHQASDDDTLNRNGIGDIALMGNCKVFNHVSATAGKKLITQQL